MTKHIWISLLLLSPSTGLSQNPYEVRGRDWSPEVQAYMSEAREGYADPVEQRAHKKQLLRQLPPELRRQLEAATGDLTVQESAVPFATLDLSTLPELPPEYGPLEGYLDAFEGRRDERFLDDPDPRHGAAERRITWLYAPQGCYARSLLMSQGMVAAGHARPLTIFVFPLNRGEWLHFDTPYSPMGYVEWGFHVAPVVLQEGALTVLDPALDPYAPLPVEEWLTIMLPSPESANVAICGAYALLPDGSCWSSPASNDTRVYYDEQPLMVKEWNLLERMGYDPEALLGDNPPW